MTRTTDFLNDFAQDIKTCVELELSREEWQDEKERLIEEYADKINRGKELEYANKNS